MPTTDDVFAAVANRHRRRLLDLLLAEPQSVNALAAHFDMRRPSVSEHLKVLRDAGLVSEERHGRERVYRVDAERLRPVADWLTPYEAYWRDALRDLRAHLDRNPEP
ncbi:metalloregulator ArsR/SmtB family transcription factor [Actinosynnema sp. NPDC050436]|uniref:ArsR/SmtB family transcription factor n=1 Tax=Actinosynnema sp. NPDC050436 TaxID=3155659 RepID=UPI0033D144E0